MYSFDFRLSDLYAPQHGVSDILVTVGGGKVESAKNTSTYAEAYAGKH